MAILVLAAELLLTPRPVLAWECVDDADCGTNDFCTTYDCVHPPFGLAYCQVGPSGNCNDANPCTVDDCNPWTLTCGYAPASCDDNNVCTYDSCSPATGCVHSPTAGACDDGNTCTVDDQCDSGTCLGTSLPDGSPCDDGDPCTPQSTCTSGSCAGPANSCDDQNACTLDGCTPTGCTHSATNGPCSDGQPCTADDQCAGTSCVGTPMQDGAECDDGSPCSLQSWCTVGTCAGTGAPEIVPITMGQPISGAACGTEDDRFTFYGTDGCTVTADLTIPDGAAVDLTMIKGTDVIAIGAVSPGHRTLSLTLPGDGDYVLRVVAPAGGPPIAYTILATASCPPPPSQCPAPEAGEAPHAPWLAPHPGHNASVQGRVCFTDWDLYAEEVASGCSVTATLWFLHAASDLRLSLVNRKNQVLAESNGASDTETISFAASTSGTVFLVVESVAGWNTAAYRLDIAVACPSFPACPSDAYEDNDTENTATSITSETELLATACSDDLDMYAINVPNGCALYATTLQASSSDTITLELYAPQGATPLVVSPGLSEMPGNRVWVVATATGQHRIVARTTSGAGEVTYSLEAHVVCADQLSCDNDFDLEPNNTGSEATRFSGGLSALGIACQSDQDNYAVMAAPGCSITAHVSPLSVSENHIILDLRRSDTQALISSSDQPSNDESVTGYACNSPLNWTISIRTNGGQGFVSYRLDVTMSCPPPGPFSCNDGNSCTSDGCSLQAGCTHVATSGSACDDGEPCTTDEACQAGICTSGQPVVCDDGNLCTTDTCDPGVGCSYSPNSNACSDGNACTTSDFCQAGSCQSGTAPNCSDGNPCTSDSCHPQLGCEHVPQAGSCDDGDACTADDLCVEGACVGGSDACPPPQVLWEMPEHAPITSTSTLDSEGLTSGDYKFWVTNSSGGSLVDPPVILWILEEEESPSSWRVVAESSESIYSGGPPDLALYVAPGEAPTYQVLVTPKSSTTTATVDVHYCRVADQLGLDFDFFRWAFVMSEPCIDGTQVDLHFSDVGGLFARGVAYRAGDALLVGADPLGGGGTPVFSRDAYLWAFQSSATPGYRPAYCYLAGESPSACSVVKRVQAPDVDTYPRFVPTFSSTGAGGSVWITKTAVADASFDARLMWARRWAAHPAPCPASLRDPMGTLGGMECITDVEARGEISGSWGNGDDLSAYSLQDFDFDTDELLYRDRDGDGLPWELEKALGTCDSALGPGPAVGVRFSSCSDVMTDVALRNETFHVPLAKCPELEGWPSTFPCGANGWCAAVSCLELPPACHALAPQCWWASDSDNDGALDPWEVTDVTVAVDRDPEDFAPFYGFSSSDGSVQAKVHYKTVFGKDCPTGMDCVSTWSLPLSSLGPANPREYDVWAEVEGYVSGPGTCGPFAHRLIEKDHQFLTRAFEEEGMECPFAPWAFDPNNPTAGTGECAVPGVDRFRINLHLFDKPDVVPQESCNAAYRMSLGPAPSFFNAGGSSYMMSKGAGELGSTPARRYSGLFRFVFLTGGGNLEAGMASGRLATVQSHNPDALDPTWGVSTAALIHEIGHTLGLRHTAVFADAWELDPSYGYADMPYDWATLMELNANLDYDSVMNLGGELPRATPCWGVGAHACNMSQTNARFSRGLVSTLPALEDVLREDNLRETGWAFTSPLHPENPEFWSQSHLLNSKRIARLSAYGQYGFNIFGVACDESGESVACTVDWDGCDWPTDQSNETKMSRGSDCSGYPWPPISCKDALAAPDPGNPNQIVSYDPATSTSKLTINCPASFATDLGAGWRYHVHQDDNDWLRILAVGKAALQQSFSPATRYLVLPLNNGPEDMSGFYQSVETNLVTYGYGAWAEFFDDSSWLRVPENLAARPLSNVGQNWDLNVKFALRWVDGPEPAERLLFDSDVLRIRLVAKATSGPYNNVFDVTVETPYAPGLPVVVVSEAIEGAPIEIPFNGEQSPTYRLNVKVRAGASASTRSLRVGLTTSDWDGYASQTAYPIPTPPTSMGVVWVGGRQDAPEWALHGLVHEVTIAGPADAVALSDSATQDPNLINVAAPADAECDPRGNTPLGQTNADCGPASTCIEWHCRALCTLPDGPGRRVAGDLECEALQSCRWIRTWEGGAWVSSCLDP